MGTPLEYTLTNSNKEGMILYIKSNPLVFEELIELTISNKQPNSKRASWLLWHCTEDNDERIIKHINKILKVLDSLIEGQQRYLISILQRMKINEEQEGLLFDICYNNWIKIDKQPTIRYQAFEVLIQISKKYPDLYNEVMSLTQPHYIEPLSKGVKRSIIKLINNLKQNMSG